MDWAAHIRRIFVHIGEDITVTGSSGTADVRGLFLAPNQRLNLGIDAGINASSPRVVAITSELPAAPLTVVTTRGTHNVKDVQPDDPGGYTVLELFET